MEWEQCSFDTQRCNQQCYSHQHQRVVHAALQQYTQVCHVQRTGQCIHECYAQQIQGSRNGTNQQITECSHSPFVAAQSN